MSTNPLKTPEGDFRNWTVVALIGCCAIVIIIILTSTSPRTAFYTLTLFFLLVGGAIALVLKFSADTD